MAAVPRHRGLVVPAATEEQDGEQDHGDGEPTHACEFADAPGERGHEGVPDSGRYRRDTGSGQGWCDRVVVAVDTARNEHEHAQEHVDDRNDEQLGVTHRDRQPPARLARRSFGPDDVPENDREQHAERRRTQRQQQCERRNCPHPSARALSRHRGDHKTEASHKQRERDTVGGCRDRDPRTIDRKDREAQRHQQPRSPIDPHLAQDAEKPQRGEQVAQCHRDASDPDSSVGLVGNCECPRRPRRAKLPR